VKLGNSYSIVHCCPPERGEANRCTEFGTHSDTHSWWKNDYEIITPFIFIVGKRRNFVFDFSRQPQLPGG
jgi:hypothetical protein